MHETKIVKKSILLMLWSLLVGCSGTNTPVNNYLEVNSLSQERLFLIKKPLVFSHVSPTIPFPSPLEANRKTKSGGVSPVIKALVDVVAPDLIEGSMDLVGKSILTISGKNDETTTIEAKFSNFFYKDATYNLIASENPSFNLLFISGEFGESVENWRPKGLEHKQQKALQSLHLVRKPNFYMEARIFPIPETQYMEIVPTYIFYNRTFNPKGRDSKRDLEIRFNFYEINNSSDNNLFSEGRVVLRDVRVGKEYSEKELANVRTTFIKMPKISEHKKGYSGAYNLKVSVTETRDINEWLASLGETISASKKDMSSKIYLSEEVKIDRDTSLAKAKIEVQIIEAKIEEAKFSNLSEATILELEKKLLDKKALANKEAIKFGKSKIY